MAHSLTKILWLNNPLMYVLVLSLCFLPGHISLSNSRRHKKTLLRVLDTNRRVKNGYACTIEPNHRKVFSSLDFKKTLVINISNISVNLRRETGGLVPFAGGGKVVLALKFQKFLQLINMYSYYHNQANLPTSRGIIDNEAVDSVY